MVTHDNSSRLRRALERAWDCQYIAVVSRKHGGANIASNESVSYLFLVGAFIHLPKHAKD